MSFSLAYRNSRGLLYIVVFFISTILATDACEKQNHTKEAIRPSRNNTTQQEVKSTDEQNAPQGDTSSTSEDEGKARNRSRFPENPESYKPLPIPNPDRDQTKQKPKEKP